MSAVWAQRLMASGWRAGGLALSRAWSSRFARNVATVASGTAGAQAITMAFSPLITRIYAPDVFGLQGTFLAMVGVAIPLAALGYPIAIVLPRKEREALTLVRLSAIVSLAVAVVAAIGLWLCGDWLVSRLGVESVAAYLLLIPLAMLFAAWLRIAEQWLIRTKEFGVLARSAVANAVVLNCSKVGIGSFHPVAVVLIMVATFGHALHAILLCIGAWRRRNSRPPEPSPYSARSMRELARIFRDFPMYRAPQDFINAASQSLPILMLSAFFGPATAGYYALGRMAMGLPSNLLGKSVTDVFYPRITEAAHAKENLVRHIVGATGALFAIGVVPFGFVMFLGPAVFDFVFGEEWTTAGEYARWLALFFLFNFINKPSVATVPVLGIQRGLLVYEFFSTGGKVLGLAAGVYWLESDLWAVALFSVIGVLAYTIMISWILLEAKRWSAHAKAGR